MANGVSPEGNCSLAALDWLDSVLLQSIARRAACHFGLAASETPDLLQELRVAIWHAGPSATINASWVYAVARNKAIDLRRTQVRRIRTQRSTDVRDSSSPSEQRELTALVRARISGLPGPMREYLDLRFWQGFSQRETALRLGLPRGIVRGWESYCLAIVRGTAPPGRKLRKPGAAFYRAAVSGDASGTVALPVARS